MPVEDSKHHTVVEEDPNDPGGNQDAGGEWEVIVHDCITPSLAEILKRRASVGTIWRCPDSSCGHKWKLINHTKHGTIAALAKENTLVWRRITPLMEDGE